MPANRFFVAAFALLSVFAANPLAYGEGLRIETDVYVGDEIESVSHNITLFDTGAVYDFSEQAISGETTQITVFRPPTSSRPGQFILLDLKTKQRTEVSTKRISGLMKKLVRWASEQDDPLLKFAAEPTFEQQFDEASGMLSLESENWQYQVATVPAENATMLARYREFTDWYTRLNTMMHGNPPPGPRLELNAALQTHSVVPVEIHRKVDSQSTKVRATHLFTWRLSREDRARLDQARRYLTSFEKVDNEAFLASRAEEEVVRGQSK
ncbi:MAG: hypothetical protein GXP28_11315 [Planctomycetes bacterium]|nr:hypothetical protein [Planctomycetota bacterium]